MVVLSYFLGSISQHYPSFQHSISLSHGLLLKCGCIIIFSRKYIPALSKFPAQYIFEPWTAPKAVQEKCGCIIGKEYPKPIVDHDQARKANISRMAAAYARRGGGGGDKKGIFLGFVIVKSKHFSFK